MKLSRYAASASLAVLLAASAGSAFAATPVKLSGHVAKWVAKSAMVGTANEGQTVRLKAFLGFRNPDDLKALMARQQTPGSADYNHYLTAAQFHQLYAPSAADAAKVEDSLRALGFTVTGRPPSNLYVDFTGTVGQIKTAFAVSQNLYSYQGKVMRANVEEPTIPASMSSLVKAVVGLNDGGQLTHPFHRSINDEVAATTVKAAAVSATTNASPAVAPPMAANLPSPYCSSYFGDNVAALSTRPTPYPAAVPWLVCGYTPQNMREAYGSNLTSMDGTGVTVAIVDAYTSPTLIPDANRYSKHHNLPTLTAGTNFTQYYGANIKEVPASDPCGPQGWFTEISLDVDAVHSMAPGANIVYSGGLSCSNVDLESAVYTVVDGTATVGGPLADIITNSYGQTGEGSSTAEMAVEDAIFEQADVEGVSVLFSSGDNGDVAYEIGIADASYPASDPLVTAVGGTSLALRNAHGIKLEWGWGTFRSYLSGVTVNSNSSVTDSGVGSFSFYAGSGGGPSFDYLQPSYQTPVVPKKLTVGTYDTNGNYYSIANGQQIRVTPDISMDADPYTGFLYGETFTIAGNAVADSGCMQTTSVYEFCEESIGGTSLASPLFAGTLALVLQARKANGLGDLGLINPRLYKLAVGPHGSTTTPLTDITPPSDPTAVLRGYVTTANTVRLVTMNSTPGPSGPLCTTSYCNGQDSLILQTRTNYDDVTGLGVPYVPALISTLGAQP